MAVVTEPLLSFQFKKFAVARSISFCNNGRTVCRVANFNPFSLVLTKGTKIAFVEDPKVIASCTRVNQAVTPQDLSSMSKQSIDKLKNLATEYGFEINSELTPNQRQELLQILFNYKDVFARSLAEIKRYPHYELDIELMDNRKVFKRNYRLRPEEAETAQKLIQELEDADIIEEASSPDYNSPIFLVRKKNGTSRPVVDLRHINSLIRPKLIQLPNIDDLLDTITALKPKFLSCFDLRAGFWQIGVNERSRPLTSFTAPDGRRFMYKSVPMGLSVASAAMLKVLLHVFSGKNTSIGLYTYMDDILLVAPDWETHL